jgi:hypothetical protein
MPEKRILKGVQVQFQGPDFVRLETYRKSQPIIPTMAATVRGLVLLGLQAADGAGAKRPDLSKRPSIKESTTTA